MAILAFLAANWLYLLIGAIVLTYIGVSIYKFSKLPIDQKYSRISAYLLYLVTIAEEEWGSGTGLIKLGEVYAGFTKKYPIIAIFMPFDTFKKLVDSALVKMREMLEKKAESKRVSASCTDSIKEWVRL